MALVILSVATEKTGTTTKDPGGYGIDTTVEASGSWDSAIGPPAGG